MDSTASGKKSQPSVTKALEPKPNGDELQPTGPPPPDTPAVVNDDFSLEAMRLNQDFATEAGIESVLTTVPVTKPDKEWFVRVHPAPAYQTLSRVLELKSQKEDRGVYQVHRRFWEALSQETTFSPRYLFTAVNTYGTVFIWPVRPPDSSKREDTWNQSAFDAARQAQKQWVRVYADMSAQGYRVVIARNQLSEPRWPKESFQEILNLAFRERQIRDWNHPILRRLRGE
jgi:hypothetical protein